MYTRTEVLNSERTTHMVNVRRAFQYPVGPINVYCNLLIYNSALILNRERISHNTNVRTAVHCPLGRY